MMTKKKNFVSFGNVGMIVGALLVLLGFILDITVTNGFLVKLNQGIIEGGIILFIIALVAKITKIRLT